MTTDNVPQEARANHAPTADGGFTEDTVPYVERSHTTSPSPFVDDSEGAVTDETAKGPQDNGVDDPTNRAQTTGEAFYKEPRPDDAAPKEHIDAGFEKPDSEDVNVAADVPIGDANNTGAGADGGLMTAADATDGGEPQIPNTEPGPVTEVEPPAGEPAPGLVSEPDPMKGFSEVDGPTTTVAEGPQLEPEHQEALATAGATPSEIGIIASIDNIKERIETAIANGEEAVKAELEKLRSEIPHI